MKRGRALLPCTQSGNALVRLSFTRCRFLEPQLPDTANPPARNENCAFCSREMLLHSKKSTIEPSLHISEPVGVAGAPQISDRHRHNAWVARALLRASRITLPQSHGRRAA